MTRSQTRSDVQDLLIGAGTPSALPPPWSGLPQTELVDLPLSRTLLRRLGKEFDRETLRQAGVVELNGRGSIAFSPRLVENPKYVSVLRSEPGGPAHDLLLGTARTLSGRPAWAAALEHCELKKLIADGQNQLFVVVTPEDFAVLRALGLAVIPAAGLDCLARDEIETLRGLLDVAPELASGDDGPDASPASDVEGAIEPCAEAVDPDGRSESGPPDDKLDLVLSDDQLEVLKDLVAVAYEDDGGYEQPVSRRGYTLPAPPPLPLVFVLVNFSVATLGRDDVPAAATIASHLLAVGRKSQLPLEEIVLWKPRVEWLGQLKSAVEEEDFARARELFDGEIADDFTSLAHGFGAATGGLARPANYTEAVAESLRRDPLSDELDDAERFADLLAAQNEWLVKPLNERGERTADPLLANRYHILALESQLLFAAGGRLMDSVRGSCGAASSGIELPKELFKQFQQLAHDIHKVSKELNTCQTTGGRRRRRRPRRRRP